MVDATCTVCSKRYQAQRSTSRYCSPLCASRAKEARRSPRTGRPTATTARVCEWCGADYRGRWSSRSCSKPCQRALSARTKACPIPWKQCPTCGDWRIERGPKRHCSEFCYRVDIGHRTIATPIQYGACQRCGACFIRRAGMIGAHCSTRCAQATRKRNRKHIQRSRSKQGERITLQGLGARDGWRCHLCGKTVTSKPGNLPTSPSVDHLVPLAHGGDHVWSNVALAHRACNTLRSDTGAAQLRLIA